MHLTIWLHAMYALQCMLVDMHSATKIHLFNFMTLFAGGPTSIMPRATHASGLRMVEVLS